jgi:hypothetical protein
MTAAAGPSLAVRILIISMGWKSRMLGFTESVFGCGEVPLALRDRVQRGCWWNARLYGVPIAHLLFCVPRHEKGGQICGYHKVVSKTL